jgi:hypothetical protein
MAGKDIAASGAVFTANGGTDGTITVASTTPFRAKARAWVSDANSPSVEVIITEITDSTHLKVRLVTPPPAASPDQAPAYALNALNYGTSDMSAYTTAQTARIDMPSQFIYNEPVP